MNKVQLANKQIAAKLAQIDVLYAECASIAEQAGIGYFCYSGPAGYGDGGGWSESGWQASSQSC